MADECNAADGRILIDWSAAGGAGHERGGIGVHGGHHDRRANQEGRLHIRTVLRAAEEGVRIAVQDVVRM